MLLKSAGRSLSHTTVFEPMSYYLALQVSTFGLCLLLNQSGFAATACKARRVCCAIAMQSLRCCIARLDYETTQQSTTEEHA